MVKNYHMKSKKIVNLAIFIRFILSKFEFEKIKKTDNDGNYQKLKDKKRHMLVVLLNQFTDLIYNFQSYSIIGTAPIR